MTSRSILITGCSSGIGYDAAHFLNKRGWRVFATCRKASDELAALGAKAGTRLVVVEGVEVTKTESILAIK